MRVVDTDTRATSQILLNLASNYITARQLSDKAGFTISKTNNLLEILLKNNKLQRMKLELNGRKRFHYIKHTGQELSKEFREVKKAPRPEIDLFKYFNNLSEYKTIREMIDETGLCKSYLTKMAKQFLESGFLLRTNRDGKQRCAQYITSAKTKMFVNQITMSDQYMRDLKIYFGNPVRDYSFAEWYCDA